MDRFTNTLEQTNSTPTHIHTRQIRAMRRVTTLALGAALAGLLLLAPAAQGKGLRMTLEATGEQLLHSAQEAAGVDPDHDMVSLGRGWVGDGDGGRSLGKGMGPMAPVKRAGSIWCRANGLIFMCLNGPWDYVIRKRGRTKRGWLQRSASATVHTHSTNPIHNNSTPRQEEIEYKLADESSSMFGAPEGVQNITNWGENWWGKNLHVHHPKTYEEVSG